MKAYKVKDYCYDFDDALKYLNYCKNTNMTKEEKNINSLLKIAIQK
jgi:hypothetical protein